MIPMQCSRWVGLVFMMSDGVISPHLSSLTETFLRRDLCSLSSLEPLDALMNDGIVCKHYY